VGAVTSGALTVGKRFMGNLELPGQFVVTLQAGLCRVSPHQPLSLGIMGQVADAALSLCHGFVDKSFAEIILLFFMTAVTEYILFPAQQPLVTGHMRIVADGALCLPDRFMHVFCCKLFFVVTFKTDFRGKGCGRYQATEAENSQ